MATRYTTRGPLQGAYVGGDGQLTTPASVAETTVPVETSTSVPNSVENELLINDSRGKTGWVNTISIRCVMTLCSVCLHKDWRGDIACESCVCVCVCVCVCE